MAYINRITFAHTGRNEGCTCDRCGQWITNIWTVHYTDGVTINYGIDCFEKLQKDSKLNDFGQKVMKKALKSIEKHQKELDEYVSGKKTAENDGAFQFQQEYGGYWRGKDYEEYRQWMINEVYPLRFAEDQKEIDRFKKINFIR